VNHGDAETDSVRLLVYERANSSVLSRLLNWTCEPPNKPPQTCSVTYDLV